MITINTPSDAPKNVTLAVQKSNELLSGGELYKVISARTKPFDFSDPSDISPATISQALRDLTETFTVVMYRFDRESTTGGYTCGSRSKRILKLSNRPDHIDNSVSVIVSTLIHECIHALDCFHKEFKIGHNKNERTGKENTAPYWIGDKAGSLVDETNTLTFSYDVLIEEEAEEE